MSHTQWFNEARYGMFVHWGPYAAAGRGEWVMNRERIAPDEYLQACVQNFTAERYDPRRWVELARAAGMKYVILTSRHHDGFCLWDSDTTDYNAVKHGPGRDLVGPFIDAARDGGLRVGLYYSVADWRHPDYPTAYARDWPKQWHDEGARRRFVQYYQAQLEELLTRYGPIDILWYDGCIPGPLDGGRVNRRVKELQPDILINERNGEPFDYRVAEQTINPKDGPWEACMTLNDNWGYHAGDHNWKTPRDVIRMLVSTAAAGGNLLLNVGPRADGTIPEPSVQVLTEAGQWLARNREFLPCSDRSPFSWNHCGVLTTKGDCVYVHLFHSPGRQFRLAEIANRVLRARRLDDGREVPFEQRDRYLLLKDLPCPLDGIATSIALDCDGPPEPVTPRGTFWIPE